MTTAVMIVDDSLTVRMDLVEAFEQAGLSPLPCATLADARATLARASIGAVVLDVNLPDGDGIDFLRELRAGPARNLPVLVLSTEAEVRDRVRALKTGADDYVGKPYDREYVVAKARQLLRARDAPQGHVPTVLVIDDSTTFREALRERLEANGYRALCAMTGEEGLRIAADRRPSAIVVDGVLPGMDGRSVVRRIRLDAALRTMPCILLTASDEPGAELQALDAGADAFARKHEDFDVILARLAAVLRSDPAHASDAASSLGPHKVLAVGSPDYLRELGNALRGDGYELVLARTGDQALELLAVDVVDCIVLDLATIGGGTNGAETCRRIKAAPGVRDIPLVALAEHDDRAALLDGLAAGADDCVARSSEHAVLQARLRAQIRRKRAELDTRRAREHALRAAHAEELARKNEELEAFSYSVSHDLRAPLRSIDGFSRALAEDFADKLDEDGRDYIKRIRSAAARMSNLIDDLLMLARVTRAELVRQRVDLSELALAVLRELAERHPDRRVDVRVQPGMIVHGDPGLLRTVLENLLGNAWKYSARRELAVIEVGEIVDGERVIFVRDNGTGFDQSRADKLFRPFQRLHAATQFEGTGIGLATVHRIVARHGGRVWAEAVLERGASVYFTLGQE